MEGSTAREAPPATAAADLADRVVAGLATVMHAPNETLRLPLLCLLAEGHVLVEDVPGVGKTVLAKALARTLDLQFSRLQFTPDLLPVGRDGRQRLRPAGRALPLPARPGLRQRAARRRGQPRLAEDAVGAARVDAGDAGHGRRRELPARSAVPRDRDPEPRRVRGHLPAARGPARPLRREDVDRLPAARRRGADARRADRRAAARPHRARRGPRRAASTPSPRRATSSSRRASTATWWRSCATRGATGTWPSARARAPGSRSCGSRRRARSSSGATFVTPDDIREMADARALAPAPARARGALGRARPGRRRPRGTRRNARTGVRRRSSGAIATRAHRPRRIVGVRLDARSSSSASGSSPPGVVRAPLGARRARARSSFERRLLRRRADRGRRPRGRDPGAAPPARCSAARSSCASGSARSSRRCGCTARAPSIVFSDLPRGRHRLEPLDVALTDPLGLERVEQQARRGGRRPDPAAHPGAHVDLLGARRA